MDSNRNQTDTNWPINYPAVVIAPFTAPAGQALTWINARLGDEVKVTSKEDRQSRGICIQYPNDDSAQQTGRRGWVPLSILNIGTACKIGEPMLVHIGEPSRIKLSNDAMTTSSTAGLLFKTITGLLSSYYHHRNDLPTTPGYIESRLNNATKVRDFATRMCSGIRAVNPKLENLLNSGNFDVMEICGFSWNAKKSGKTGIYNMLNSRYSGQPNRAPELYTGSTGVSFQDRYTTHSRDRAQQPPKGVHYRSGAAAERHDYYPIVIMEDLDADQSDLKIAEQVVNDLFQTTCDAVLDYQTWGETDDDPEGSDYSIGQTPNAEKLSRVAKYQIDKDQACILRHLATQVFARTKWPGGVRRAPDQLTPQGQVAKDFIAKAGLNWSMPLTEIRHATTTWAMTSLPGKYANFRRTGLRLRDHDGRKVIWQKNMLNKNHHFQFYLEKDLPGPAIGTKLHVVYELRLDGQAHPCAFSRAPTVGCFSDWADCTKLGMRIEWQDDDGRWWYRYVQLDNSYNTLVMNGPVGATTGYVLATALRSFFLQERRPLQQHSWLYDFGIARLKEVYIDHLTQTIRVRQPHNPHDVPAFTRRTFDQMGNELLGLGAERVARDTDASFPNFAPGAPSRMGPPRKSCDHCNAGRKIVSFPKRHS